MAVIGLIIIAFRMIKWGDLSVSKDFLRICALATAFTVVCLHSVICNNTSDYAYASYLISMLIWMSAAYAACQFIQWVHGTISFRLLANYLIGICVVQCLLALLINFSLPVKILIDTYINQGADFLNEIGRIYGIGVGTDVAGTRFAAVLVILMVLICIDEQIQEDRKKIVLYIVAFVIIAVVGNMIARTTSIGLIIALAYLVYTTIFRINIRKNHLLLWKWVLIVGAIMVALVVYLYNYNENIHDLLRFGFEGFFNWVEHGKWETRSTDHLRTMWIWPESDKTWLWGDGYFLAPFMTDPDYQGNKIEFYMNTDIGFLRFIFYCGLPGLLIFCGLLFYMAVLCHKKYNTERILFYILFFLQLVIFTKVATDLFLVYAYFYSANIQKKSSFVNF